MVDENKHFKVLRKSLTDSQQEFEAARDVDDLKEIVRLNQVKYKDLSNPLKAAVILAYIVGSIYILSFTIGFIIGLGGL